MTCAPFRTSGSRPNGRPASVRCPVTMKLPIWPGPIPPFAPRGLASRPLSWIRSPERSSGVPVYAITRSLRTLIDGMLSVVGPAGRAVVGGSSTPVLVGAGVGLGVVLGVVLVGLGAGVVTRASGVAVVSEQ